MILLNFFFVFPFLLVGLPTSLFDMSNSDSQNHEVIIEIFDSSNESIFKEKYELTPGEGISQPKSLWLVLQFLMPLPDERAWKDDYTFKVILDGEIEKTYKIVPSPWTSVEIRINKENDSDSPIFIGAYAV